MARTCSTSQPVHSAVRWARILATWSASAPEAMNTNWAYALFRTARRLIKPFWKKGRLNASVLDLAMTVLSRSKNAATFGRASSGASSLTTSA